MTQNKVLTAVSDAGRPIMVDLLALAGSSLLTLASAVEPLRAANRQSGRTVFDWRFVSVNGDAPESHPRGLPGRCQAGTIPPRAAMCLLSWPGLARRK
jgi:transcriptional regulator GlxA family with amidase domain